MNHLAYATNKFLPLVELEKESMVLLNEIRKGVSSITQCLNYYDRVVSYYYM
jgi:hypothetical protein